MTKTIAKEWGAFNVRANTVAFGYIETRLTQAKELGETSEDPSPLILLPQRRLNVFSVTPVTVNGQKIALGILTGGAPAPKGPLPGVSNPTRGFPVFG